MKQNGLITGNNLQEKKRDQRSYDAIQQYLPSLILDRVLNVIGKLDEPYHNKPGVGGPRGYSPKTMAAICILKEAEKKTFRGISGHIKSNKELQAKLGLDTVPSKNAIHRAYSLIPESYLNEIHARIVVDVKTGHAAAGDSTGVSERRYEQWIDYRTDKIKSKKGWMKLHAIIDVKTRIILAYFITNSHVADISAMYTMLGKMSRHADPNTPDFCLDAAYLSRDMCDMLSRLGFAPYIKPKKNTVHNANGSQSWRKMVDMHQENPDQFNEHYHQRSIVESVFGALKTTYGSYVKCKRPDNKRREIAMRVICHSIDMVSRSQLEDGRLTLQSLETLCA